MWPQASRLLQTPPPGRGRRRGSIRKSDRAGRRGPGPSYVRRLLCDRQGPGGWLEAGWGARAGSLGQACAPRGREDKWSLPISQGPETNPSRCRCRYLRAGSPGCHCHSQRSLEGCGAPAPGWCLLKEAGAGAAGGRGGHTLPPTAPAGARCPEPSAPRPSPARAVQTLRRPLPAKNRAFVLDEDIRAHRGTSGALSGRKQVSRARPAPPPTATERTC